MFEAVVPYFPQLLDGIVLTLKVSLGSVAVGLIIALVLAPLSAFGAKPVRACIAAYVTVIRGVPELLVIFLVFYGGTILLTRLAGGYVEVSALPAGIFALAAVSGAYLTEILRAALQDVPVGQWEAARALGLKPVITFRKVILPQMLARALPGLGNQWLIILKDSALVSIIGLEELMRKAVIGAGATHDPLAFYLTAAVLYVMITGFSSVFLGIIQMRLGAHGR